MTDTQTNADLGSQQAQLFALLSEKEREQLSLVLFPETDTREVTILGTKRELRPLPVKPAQRLRKALAPLVADLNKGFEETQADPSKDYDAEQVMADALDKATRILAEFYKWEDVLAALDGDGLSVTDYQGLAAVQVEVNGSNDFLLAGLRAVVQWMRIGEILTLRFQSTLTGQRS